MNREGTKHYDISFLAVVEDSSLPEKQEIKDPAGAVTEARWIDFGSLPSIKEAKAGFLYGGKRFYISSLCLIYESYKVTEADLEKKARYLLRKAPKLRIKIPRSFS